MVGKLAPKNSAKFSRNCRQRKGHKVYLPTMRPQMTFQIDIAFLYYAFPLYPEICEESLNCIISRNFIPSFISYPKNLRYERKEYLSSFGERVKGSWERNILVTYRKSLFQLRCVVKNLPRYKQ